MVTRVKICGITNLDDAQAAVAAGADALGFVFQTESPRHVKPADAGKMARQLPGHLIRVGVFVDPAPDLVVAAIRECDLTMLQFHGAEEPDFCRQFGVMTIKAFRVRNVDSLDLMEDYDADALLLDSFVPGKPGGTGQTFNWSLAFEARRFGKPIFLAGGLTPENVASAVRAAKPFGVDVSSGVEASPGKKDHEKIRAFVSAVRALGDV